MGGNRRGPGDGGVWSGCGRFQGEGSCRVTGAEGGRRLGGRVDGGGGLGGPEEHGGEHGQHLSWVGGRRGLGGWHGRRRRHGRRRSSREGFGQSWRGRSLASWGGGRPGGQHGHDGVRCIDDVRQIGGECQTGHVDGGVCGNDDAVSAPGGREERAMNGEGPGGRGGLEVDWRRRARRAATSAALGGLWVGRRRRVVAVSVEEGGTRDRARQQVG